MLSLSPGLVGEGARMRPVSPLLKRLSCGEQQGTRAGASSGVWLPPRGTAGGARTLPAAGPGASRAPATRRVGSSILLLSKVTYLYCVLTYIPSLFVLFCFIQNFLFQLAKSNDKNTHYNHTEIVTCSVLQILFCNFTFPSCAEHKP